jgi:sulfate/thiosulfate-binding protein
MFSKGLFLICLVLLLFYTAPVFMPELAKDSPTVVIYGFSILEEVITLGILPAFQASWRERTGEEVRFYTSFSGSGTVMNQIRFGAPADIAIFSHTLDAYRLQEAGLIKTDWSQFPHSGIINRTPIIFIVRRGNPKEIGSFHDLRRPGMRIVHPDPQTSGGALWSILAEYGAFVPFLKEANVEAAYEGLYDLWKNVIILGGSARAARTQFEMGFGDVLITYEQEAVRDLSLGTFKHEAVIPQRTICSEHPVTVIDHNILPEERLLVQAFLDFLWTEEAQRIFVQYGFRSVTGETLDNENPFFSQIPASFTVEDLGGWKTAYSDIIEGLWKNRVLEEIRQ